MSTFKFKHFTITQDVAAVKVGTDAMLLGAFTDVSTANKVLEIGTGTGVISLMLAQKKPILLITALEIDLETAREAAYNVASSSYSEQITVCNHDFLTYSFTEQVDLIVTNPPYFECGLFPEDPKHQIAKHIDRDKMDAWFYKMSTILDNLGLCWMILPFDSFNTWIELGNKYGLFVQQQINLYAKPSVCKRVILCFSKILKNILQSDFLIREVNGDYTVQYIELTKDFHDRIPIR